MFNALHLANFDLWAEEEIDMGIFGDVKRDIGLKQVQQVCENSGLYPGSHQENCESCRHVVKGKCVTGLACSGRTMNDGGYMVTLASWKCDNFER